MGDDARVDLILRPLEQRTSRRFLLLIVLALAGLAWFAYAWSFQLRHGLIVTGFADWGSGGGIPWGFYEGAFIWWVGIAHGGIIVSAAVRLFHLDDFKPVARLAEILTLGALVIAALYVVIHLGRPDRMVTSILAGLSETVHTSPLTWDMTVITLYLVLTATYLGLTLRIDLYALRDRLPRRLRPLHRVLLVGHRPGDEHKLERMAWWLALCVIILAPLFLHGGVIPWLFALLPGTPGWFGPVQGPQFLAAALTSALGAVIILAYVFRRVYGWHELIPDRVFTGLARWLALFGLLFLWLQLQKVITGIYAPPAAVGRATEAMVGEVLYWVAMGLILIAVAYFGAQMRYPQLFRVHRTVAAAVLPLLAVLVEKTLFVVEGLMYPVFTLYEGVPGTYVPSWVELSTVVGAFSILILFFAVVSRLIPLVEVVEEPQEHETEEVPA